MTTTTEYAQVHPGKLEAEPPATWTWQQGGFLARNIYRVRVMGYPSKGVAIVKIVSQMRVGEPEYVFLPGQETICCSRNLKPD